jgi:DNA repair exonuclease SbcCD ATPase subunit
MPGVEPPGLEIEDFSSGLNVIHGPNAAGKTTLARAFNSLLWSDRYAPDRAILEGTFWLEDDEWYVEYNAGRYRFQREGKPVDPPPLPAGDQADRYNLALHDLLQDETTNRTFAEFIVRELSGGYDLAGAVETLGFDDSPSGRGKTTSHAETAVESLREAREAMGELDRQESERRRLEQELERVEEAQKRYEYFVQLKEWHEAREDYREQQRTLEQFPEVMEAVNGNETDQLEQLQEEIDKLERQKERAESNRDDAEHRLEGLDYPYEEDASDTLRELRTRFETLKDVERDIDDIEQDLEETRSKRANEAGNLGDEMSRKELESLDRAEYEELSDFAREYESVLNQLETYDQLKSLLTGKEDDDLADLDTYKRGCDVLENWLANPPKASDGRTEFFSTPLVVASVFIAGLSVVSGFYIHFAFFGLLVVPVILHLWSRGIGDGSFSSGREGDFRTAAREEFDRLELEIHPDEWTTKNVRSVLDDLYEQRAQCHLQDRFREVWARRKDEYEELKENRETLEEERNEVVDTYGFAPDDSRTLYELTNRLSRWQDADSQVKGLEEKLENRREKRNRILNSLNEEFEKWDLQNADDSAEVNGRLETIESRINDYREARRQHEQAKQKLEEAQGQLPELRNDKESLYRELELEPGDEAGLRDLCDRYEEYRSERKERDRRQAVMENEYDGLETMGPYKPDHENWDRSEIDRMIEDTRSEAEEYDDIREKITEIKTKIKEAKKSYEVEPAIAEKQRAMDALYEQFEEDCESMIGDVLCKYVRSVNTDRTMPAVFKRAREWLVRITSGRYELDVQRGDTPDFRVREKRTGEGKSLNELSSGTRVQVLMAVRLAFVEQGEKRAKLPLYMDESLANADDEKARIIIESTRELIQSGRQVFYFTAQGDEVAKWQAYAEDPNVIDLTEHRDRSLEGTVDVPDPQEVQGTAAAVPTADGLTHEEYGEKLDVPPLDPRQPMGAVHLWYLVEDPDVLQELLEKNLRRWGPFENFLGISSDEILDTDGNKTLERVTQLGDATDAFIEHWRQGRNRRIDRSVLEQTDAVSDSFIDDVAELTEACNGDPEELVERLREGDVSGFRTAKMDELERYLKDNDYIDERDRLNDDVIRAAMIAELDENLFESPATAVDRLLTRIHTNLK